MPYHFLKHIIRHSAFHTFCSKSMSKHVLIHAVSRPYSVLIANSLKSFIYLTSRYYSCWDFDCFWYGGHLGSVRYRGYLIDVEVHGEVRAPIFDKDGNEDYHYVNKNNDVAYSYSEVRNLVKDDAELYALIKNRRIYIGDDNWVEVLDGKDTGSIFDVFGDDVLDVSKSKISNGTRKSSMTS